MVFILLFLITSLYIIDSKFIHLIRTDSVMSRLFKAFLPRSKPLLISWLQSPSAVILECKKNKVHHCFHCFPIYLP